MPTNQETKIIDTTESVDVADPDSLQTDDAELSLPRKGERRFSVVVPADAPGAELCKNIMGAIALGYPSPIIVNWGRDFGKSSGGFGGSHLGKISGVLEYLDGISHKEAHEGDKMNNDDLVMIVDAYDLWFQLPPNVLLERYHRQIQEANARLAAQWKGLPGEMPMKQTIIVSAQKRCFPDLASGSNLHCSALPDSVLPTDVYGPNTDKENPEIEAEQFHDVRPKFLNSGTVIGPVGDMRRYFRRVLEKMNKGISQNKHLFSDQGIFGEVFGEQELWRTMWRDLHRSGSAAALDSEAMKVVLHDFEYHVGLDYVQNLFIPTVFEEKDGIIISMNNHSGIANRSAELEISPVRLTSVPDDIQESHNPLSDVLPTEQATQLDWNDMPLYADFYTTAIPVILHHNAHRGGSKKRRKWWWDQIWYFPHLRALLERELEPSAPRPLATLPATGGQLRYWAPSSDGSKRKPRIFEVDSAQMGLNEIFDWGNICHSESEQIKTGMEWHEEVFRDGKGPI